MLKDKEMYKIAMLHKTRIAI